MEEIEITSWLTLDAIKKDAAIVDTVGDLQSGHWQSIFCRIEDDFLELFYLDTESNYLRRYDGKDEFELALEIRKEDIGEARYKDDHSFEEDDEDSGDSNIEFLDDEEAF
ncbi:hypothetical protein ACFLT9_06175 [Acidobacteriota bacterium]